MTFEPDSPWAYGLRGAAWLGLGETAHAAEDIRVAVSLAPDQAYFHYLLSFVWANEGDYESSLNSIELAICLQPNAQYFARRADIFIKTKEFQKARASAEEALELDSNLEAALIARSIALFKLGSTTEAEATLHTALSLNPENPAAHSLLGSFGLLIKPPEVVASHLREARRISPLRHNQSSALKIAYGRLIWPFSVIDGWRRRYLSLTPQRRWLLDVSIATSLTTLLAATQSTPNHPSGIAIVVFILLANVVALANYLDVHTPLAAALFNRREFGVRLPGLIWSIVKHFYCWACMHLFLVSGVAILLAVLQKSALFAFCVVLNWPMAKSLLSNRVYQNHAMNALLMAASFGTAVSDFYWNTPPQLLMTMWIGIVALSAIANKQLYWHRPVR